MATPSVIYFPYSIAVEQHVSIYIIDVVNGNLLVIHPHPPTKGVFFIVWVLIGEIPPSTDLP